MSQTRIINATPDERWMQRALDLARRGIALCSPNPVVGCLILSKDEKIIAEGWHEYATLDHAEIVALKAAGASAGGATAYVTLEPCNHTGRTGPCTEALIKAGIRRVVIATEDPNPLVSGKGIARLRQAGIELEVGVCEAEARRLNQSFARWIRSRRPFVNMKVAMTLDGRIAPPPGHHVARQPYWITGEASRAAVQELRWEADAVLTGVDTVIADDPLLTDRSNNPRRRPLLRVILDSALRMPLDSKLVQTANDDVVLFTLEVSATAATPAIQKSNAEHLKRIEELKSRGIQVVALKPESGRLQQTGLPLNSVLSWLGNEGILTLLLEAGTRLNTAFLAEDLVDQLQLFCSPQILGSDAVPAFKSLTPALKLQNIQMERYGDDLGITSLIKDPWQIQNPNQ
jgi:diaminohydroxyphosphoribosylaminopyrimidine deaminase/5-amino-6-(5-phosphoribosylamino)uracil reductase